MYMKSMFFYELVHFYIEIQRSLYYRIPTINNNIETVSIQPVFENFLKNNL